MRLLLADKYFQRYEDVTPEILVQNGVKLLLCDLDDTLRIRQDAAPKQRLIDWVNKIKKHNIKIVIISNNARKNLVSGFGKALGVDSVCFANKPIRTKLVQTMEKYHYRPNETVMLGDKWWTDILAARFAGMRGWQVEPRDDMLKEEQWKKHEK